MLSACSDVVAELDCLLALSEAAIKFRYTRPQMTEDHVLEIIKGRHPLRERSSDAFIANDTVCYGDETMASPSRPSTILLTGANYSGKSIYLRQAALIVFMAHIGSFVPAESATIGITDRILTRIHTHDSLSDGVSAFMSDLQQISKALQWMTPKSLLIIDEFGKGTDQVEGAGLFAALIDWLTLSGPFRPRCLVATHYHEVLRYGLITLTPAIALKHMEIMLDPNCDDFAKQMTYLYRLADGPSNSSFALNCAAMNGVPMGVVHRAEQLLAVIKSGENLVDVMTPLSNQERGDLRHAERVIKKFAKWDYRKESIDTIVSALREILA